MASSVSSDVEKVGREHVEEVDSDAEFGGTEARKKLERKLLWKLDLRMSILVVIYILNYVRVLINVMLNSLGLT